MSRFDGTIDNQQRNGLKCGRYIRDLVQDSFNQPTARTEFKTNKTKVR